MKFFFVLLFFPFAVPAQPAPQTGRNITGIWQGYVRSLQKKLSYELVISSQGEKFIAYSLTTFIINGDEIISLKKMTVHFQNQRIIAEDDDLLFDNFTAKAPKKIKQINTLFLNEEGSTLKLTGTFETKTNRALKPANGEVYLEKKEPQSPTKLMAKLEEMNLTAGLTFTPDDDKIKPAATEKEMAANKTVQVITSVDSASFIKIKEVINEPTIKVELAKNEIIKDDKDLKNPIIAELFPPVKARENKEEKKIRYKKATVPAPLITRAKPSHKINIPAIPPNNPPPPLIVKQPVVPKPATVIKPTPVPPAPKTKPIITVVIPPVANPKPVNIAVAPVLDLAKRKIETIQQLFIQSDSLQMTLYDNGEVDGDSVSVILNGKTIVSKQGLSTLAFTKTIYLTPELGDTVQLVMYAENLGSLPPNTGLLVLQYDKERHEIRFSGDLNKNAAITLRRKEQNK